MREATKTTVRAFLTSLAVTDSGLTGDNIQRALDALEGGGNVAIKVNSEPIDRVIPVSQVAEMLGCGYRTVQLYARKGLLRRGGATGNRHRGILESSLRAFISGKEVQG